MNRRLKIRSLLTTTSMFALIATANGAQAYSNVNNPYGTSIGQLLITTTVGSVTNDGTIANGSGDAGIDIYGAYAYGNVDNEEDGTIDVTGDHAIGIFVHGSGSDDSYVSGWIDNYNHILAADSTEDYDARDVYAAGIEVSNSGTLSGGVYNDGDLTAHAYVTSYTTAESTYDTVDLAVAASAFGIKLNDAAEEWGTGEIENDGSIEAKAKALVDQEAYDSSDYVAAAQATGNAHALAMGIDVESDAPIPYGSHVGPTIADGASIGGTIDVNATAQSFSNATAHAYLCVETTEDNCVGPHYASGTVIDHATAGAYGALFAGTAAVIGDDVYSDGTITVGALAETHSIADVTSNEGNARAYAGWEEWCYWSDTSSADATAAGLSIDVLKVSGDIENHGDITVNATAHGQSTANADATYYGTAEAGASNVADANAKGIYVDALLITGEFWNTGNVTATAKATSDTYATSTSEDYQSEAWASSHAYADAAGIDVDTSSLGHGFYNSGYNWEEDDTAVNALASAHALASAKAYGTEDTYAYATGTAEARAVGITANIGAIAGHFVNDGYVGATAVATGHQIASIDEGYYGVYAYASGDWISAEATGLRLNGDTLAGSFVNEGNLSAHATAQGFSTATAYGDYNVSAEGLNSVEAYALGLGIEENSVQDNIINTGDIGVRARATAKQTATAVAYTGEASAYAGEVNDTAVWVDASATGLNINVGDVGTNIVNTGDITVYATANITSLAKATAESSANAESRSLAGVDAYGIRANVGDVGYGEISDIYDFDYGVSRGYFVNSGDVGVFAGAQVQMTSSAVADNGDAQATALFTQDYYYSCYGGCDDSNVSAHGISLENADLRAGFLNFGTVAAVAVGSGTIEADARAYNGIDGAAAAIAGGTMEAKAVGVELSDVYIDDYGYYGEGYSGFINESDIFALAIAKQSATAHAYSDDGDASATVEASIPCAWEDVGSANYAHAQATGVDLYDVGSEDGFWNSGTIWGLAGAFAHGSAQATGDETASAFAANSASAAAVGASFSDSWMGYGIYNDGLIVGGALSYVETTAVADATAATAAIGTEEGASESRAYATGLYADSWGNYVHNSESGLIAAYALAYGDNSAEAYGRTYSYAEASNTEYASAVGIYNDSYSASGALYNDGTINARAIAAGNDMATAYLTHVHDTAYAYASDEAEADALGVYLNGNDFENYGGISANASAQSTAVASAEGYNGVADAYADARASATGVSLRLYGEDATFYNEGDITAHAQAGAHATAVGLDEAYTETTAEANAVAVEVLCGTSMLSFDNNGYISANAEASVSYDGGDSESWSEAQATGVKFSDAYIWGDITNEVSSTIVAHASAGDEANAIALEFIGGTYGGALVNDGVIHASASASDASATAILVAGGATLEGGIVNTGEISAETTYDEDDPVRGTAINIEGAGSGMTIQLKGGSVLGDILMRNEYADTIDWSGGTLSGDIHGDDGEGGDTLNIFAAEDAVDPTFTYSDTICGLSFLNINGDEHDAALTFRLNGAIRQTDNLYVGPNATMSLSTGAQVSVNSLTLNSGATLAYDIGAEGDNAVINTSTADLGGATVEAVFLDPQHPVSQTYRIINWDGSETTFGTVLSNSILEQVVAQYSEDGVDLVATRVSFGDINGLENDASSLGHALDGVFNDIDPDSPLGQALYQIILLPPDEYTQVMNAIAGQQIADIQAATFAQTGSLIQVIQTQLDAIRGGQQVADGMDSLGVRVADNQIGAMMTDASEAQYGKAAGSPISRGFSVWGRAFGDWATLDRSGARPGFTSNAGGVVVGGDYQITDALLAGLAVGYQDTDMDFRGTGGGKIKSWSVTAYGDYKFGQAYVDMLLGYSAQSYNLNRYLTVLGVDYTANSDYDGSSENASVESGYEFAIPASMKLTPFIGFNYTRTDTDAVTETGAGIWNLAYDSRSEDSAETVLGARLSRTFVTSGGTELTPTVELGWKHQFGDDSATANAALAGTPGSNFQIVGTSASRDKAIVGAALGAQLTDTIDAYLQYNGQIASNYTDNTASFRLRWKF